MRADPTVLLTVVLALSGNLARGTARQPGQTQPTRAALYTTTIPGSLAGLARVAGLSPRQRTPEELVFDIIRLDYWVRGSPATAIRELADYLDVLDDVEQARAALGPGRIDLQHVDKNRDKLRHLLSAAGLKLSLKNGAPPGIEAPPDRYSAQIRALLLDADLNVEALAQQLVRGDSVDFAVPSFTLALPESAGWFAAHIVPHRNRPVGPQLLLDQATAYLYLGLSQLDEDTRAYVADHPDVVETFGRNPGLFAAYGGSFRIYRGKVVVPGGQDAVAFWQELAGESIDRPDRFFDQILSRALGHLGYFYDFVSGLDDLHTAFALDLPDLRSTPRSAAGIAHAIFTAFDQQSAEWVPAKRPFARPQQDASLLLLQVAVDPDGQPVGLKMRSLWEAVFAPPELPRDPAKELSADLGSIDAAFWLEAVAEGGVEMIDARIETILFAQRVFGGAPASALGAILTSLRGFCRFRLLDLTLERMGIDAPTTYAASTARAEALSAIGNADRARQSISQFQGALVLIERAVYTDRIDGVVARQLVDELVAIPLDKEGSYGARLAVWIQSRLLPAISASGARNGSHPLETGLLAGIAGIKLLTQPDQETVLSSAVLQWEGFEYRVDPSAPLFARMQKIRERQDGNSLDSILTLANASLALEKPGISAKDVQTQAAVIAQSARELKDPKSPTRLTNERLTVVRSDLAAAEKDLNRITGAKQLNRAGDVGQNLESSVSLLMADELRALAYAASLGDADTPLLANGDPSYRHDLGLANSRLDERERTTWGMPHEDFNHKEGVEYQGTWHVIGSLLGLDVALSPLTLRRVTASVPKERPLWSDQDHDAVANAAALFNPFRTSDKSPALIGAALQRARARVADLSPRGADFDAVVRAARLGPRRRALLSWAFAKDPRAAVNLLSAADLLRIDGNPDALRAAEQWGSPQLPLSGCLCLALDPAADWDAFGGRAGARAYLAARSPDSLLELAEFVGDAKLSPAVAADVLPGLLQDGLNVAAPSDADDWMALVQYATHLDRHALEDRVSSVTSGHSLAVIGPIVK